VSPFGLVVNWFGRSDTEPADEADVTSPDDAGAKKRSEAAPTVKQEMMRLIFPPRMVVGQILSLRQPEVNCEQRRVSCDALPYSGAWRSHPELIPEDLCPFARSCSSLARASARGLA
jgi:hypothetical protein